VRPSDGIDSVLQEADYIVLIVPLTDDTRHLIGERELRLMKKRAWLINVSRGDVVQEPSLVQALEQEWIGGAILDVFSEEPLPPTSPLWTTPNCILTPHMSGRSPKYMQRAMEIFVANLNVYLADSDDYVNRINPAVGY
jgi:phosphoglycerate dehydrogenase-like enzyme